MEEEEAVSPSADGQPAEAPYEEEQEEVEEEEEPEEPGPEQEAPLEDASGELAESGTRRKAFLLQCKGSLITPLCPHCKQQLYHSLSDYGTNISHLKELSHIILTQNTASELNESKITLAELFWPHTKLPLN